MLRAHHSTHQQAVPGYNTSVGWLGLSDAEVEAGLKKAVDEGFHHFKLKVGLGFETDRKRLGMVRKVAGDKAVIYTDVNQLWDVDVSAYDIFLQVHWAVRGSTSLTDLFFPLGEM